MKYLEHGRVVLLTAWMAMSVVSVSVASALEMESSSTSTNTRSNNRVRTNAQPQSIDVSMSVSSSGLSSFGHVSNITDPFLQLERFRELRAEMKEDRKKRGKNRRKTAAKEFFQKLPQSPKGRVEEVSSEEWKDIDAKQKRRGLNWFGDGSSASTNAYSSTVLADPSEYYDKWAQAYRMLGGFIDCDHDTSDDSHDSGDGGGNNDGSACSRWMMWASYVNPNYQGNEYDEYYGENPTSTLDCHNPDTSWQLLGVYRQEFYQYIEQISKHLWAIADYEYVVALAGLSYMTNYDCFYVGQDSSGNLIYAGVAPQPYGKFQMALYTDGYCLTPNKDLGMTFDDFGLTTDVSLGSGDNNDDQNGDQDDDTDTWWSATQEYTLTTLNEVYEEFKYCTSCVDYPTYQDGYFIGDDGTDDDDLINQCWKFYSHDSYTCEAECIAMAHAQGSILSIKYGDSVFGSSISGFYQQNREEETQESKFSRLLANAFVTVAFLLFVATFLAFAVARRSRYRESRSSKSRRLLDDDGKRSRSARRTPRKTDDSNGGDGLFRSSSNNRSKSRSKSSKKTRSSSSKARSRTKSYDAPKEGKSRTRSPKTKDNGDYF